MTTAVIISTYNNPAWLEKTLWGYTRQTVPADEIIIADDGSDSETKRVVDSFRHLLPIRHLWHPDHGFRKPVILNMALCAATADYLIFTDQDCIPRRDFIEAHKAAARPCHFVSAGYFRLSPFVSKALAQADVETGDAFNPKWLRKAGQPLSLKMTKLSNSPLFALVLDHLTTARASFNGCNSSCWRADALAVNGFDERMTYGGLDREFGERLVNLGIRPIQMRHAIATLHLDHSRPYRTAEGIMANNAIRASVRKGHLHWTDFGIEKKSDSPQL